MKANEWHKTSTESIKCGLVPGKSWKWCALRPFQKASRVYDAVLTSKHVEQNPTSSPSRPDPQPPTCSAQNRTSAELSTSYVSIEAI